MIDNDEIFLNSKFSLSRKIWLKPKKNIQALANPEVLKEFKNLNQKKIFKSLQQIFNKYPPYLTR